MTPTDIIQNRIDTIVKDMLLTNYSDPKFSNLQARLDELTKTLGEIIALKQNEKHRNEAL